MGCGQNDLEKKNNLEKNPTDYVRDGICSFEAYAGRLSSLCAVFTQKGGGHLDATLDIHLIIVVCLLCSCP